MMHIYCGGGKGKTTAAAGLCIRMSGNGGRVLFIQFLKGTLSGETVAMQKLGIEVIMCDKEYGFWKDLDSDEKDMLTYCHNKNLRYAKENMQKFDMIVLDELCAAYNLGSVDKEEVQKFIKECTAELVITGRDPDRFFIDHADYISEINSIRHPFDSGISARKGIEY